MKKLPFILAFAVLGTQATFATPVTSLEVNSVFESLQQGNPATPKERAERLTKAMATHMNLTADQAAQVQHLNEKRFAEMQEMRQKMMAGGGDRTAMREQSMALQKKYDDLMKTAVTAEQYALYEANLDKIREEGGMRGGRGQGGGQRGGNRPQGGNL